MKKYIFTESQLKKLIESEINEQYSETDMPQDITIIQKALNQYFKNNKINLQIDVDGNWGDKSKEAMKVFQKRNNLNVTGEIDRETADKMVALKILSYDLLTKIVHWFD